MHASKSRKRHRTQLFCRRCRRRQLYTHTHRHRETYTPTRTHTEKEMYLNEALTPFKAHFAKPSAQSYLCELP